MARNRARKLRHNLTEAEVLMWSFLRDFKRAGMHFRKQVPFGPYYADFSCHSAKLIVELDGSQHAERLEFAHDAKKTEFLEGEGYKVVRIWNSELFANPGVIADYVYAVTKARLPQPEQTEGK
jgi:very-short-patch-repair endonuclease